MRINRYAKCFSIKSQQFLYLHLELLYTIIFSFSLFFNKCRYEKIYIKYFECNDTDKNKDFKAKPKTFPFNHICPVKNN